MELVRQKNQTTYIYFPLVDADGDVVSSAGSLDSQIDTWADGTAPNGFVACTNEATEIGSTGVYYLLLSSTEMNNDYIYISIASTNAKKQHILIRTMTGDPLALSTHTAANIWSISGRELSTPDNYKADISGLATSSALATAQADLDNPAQYKATGFSTHSAADVWSANNRELSTPNNYKADISGLALESSVQAIPTTLEIDSALSITHGSGAWKADISGLAPANEYDSTLAAIAADLLRLRGLNGEYLIAEYTFSGEDNITISFWQYDNESNFNTHNKSTGVIATWILNTTYASNKPTIAKSKRLS